MLDRQEASRLLQKLYDFAERIPHLSECNVEYGFDAIVHEFTLPNSSCNEVELITELPVILSVEAIETMREYRRNEGDTFSDAIVIMQWEIHRLRGRLSHYEALTHIGLQKLIRSTNTIIDEFGTKA